MDGHCHGQPTNELLQLSDSLRRLLGRLTPRLKQRCCVFKELLLPCGDLLFAEVMATTQFRLGTFTRECLKHNFRFELGSEGSSFAFRHRMLLSAVIRFNQVRIELTFYHYSLKRTYNLGLDRGLNFRWHYILYLHIGF